MWNVKTDLNTQPPETNASPEGAILAQKLCSEYEAQISKLERIIIDQERRLNEAIHWIITHSRKEAAEAFLAANARERGPA